MSQMFETIGDTALGYGASLAHNPVMKICFTVDPTLSDVGLSEWQVSLTLKCYGEIVEGTPKLIDSVLWVGHGESMSEALVDLHSQVHQSVSKRFLELQEHQALLQPFIFIHEDVAVEPDRAAPDRIVSVSAVLRPR